MAVVLLLLAVASATRPARPTPPPWLQIDRVEIGGYRGSRTSIQIGVYGGPDDHAHKAPLHAWRLTRTGDWGHRSEQADAATCPALGEVAAVQVAELSRDAPPGAVDAPEAHEVAYAASLRPAPGRPTPTMASSFAAASPLGRWWTALAVRLEPCWRPLP